MQLAELLHLLYTAHQRYGSIQVSWRYWYQVEALNEMRERYSPGSVKPLTAKKGAASKIQSPAEMTYHWQIWWRKPACWREDAQSSGEGKNIRIICDDRWLFYSAAGQRLSTNTLPEGPLHRQRVQRGRRPRGAAQIRPSLEEAVNAVPLLDPSFLLASHDLESVADIRFVEREALRVRAVFRKGREVARDPFFWGGADDYELLVDKERGILLRYAARLGEREVAVAAVEQVIFDAAIPDDVFVFTPPPNTTIELAD
jgi:hypothetical protein